MANVLKSPGLVAIPDTLNVDGTPYYDYCSYINKIILDTAVRRGAQTYDGYIYMDNCVRFLYIDSDYGNDKYCIEVNRSVWDDIPSNINPFMVNEGGVWNLVYEYQDCRDVLLFHIPGSWVNILARYR